ncbi:MAG: hypothetical protein FJ298_12410, partial [Planctomycetes bacterium]|nr:hypothetical protein [Planctomycetota bacterium]
AFVRGAQARDIQRRAIEGLRERLEGIAGLPRVEHHVVAGRRLEADGRDEERTDSGRRRDRRGNDRRRDGGRRDGGRTERGRGCSERGRGDLGHWLSKVARGGLVELERGVHHARRFRLLQSGLGGLRGRLAAVARGDLERFFLAPAVERDTEDHGDDEQNGDDDDLFETAHGRGTPSPKALV